MSQRTQIRERVAALLWVNPWYGYRKICALFRVEGYPVPERQVRDALRELRAHQDIKAPSPHTTV